MICPVCENTMLKIFDGKIMARYTVSYFQCTHCKFISTENPYWLKEAYQSAIGFLDVGLISRNISLSKKVENILKKNYNVRGKFLDYGGGYGMFVRLMRDAGFDFYRQDRFCENLFAKYFDIEDVERGLRFELVTVFEVFEHLWNPLDEIRNIFSYSDSILFSTELQQDIPLTSLKDWWYFNPEGGQHISLYTKQSLEIIARKFNMRLYSDGIGLHLFTPRNLHDPLCENDSTLIHKIVRKLKSKISWELMKYSKNGSPHLESYLQKDFDYYKRILSNSKEA